MTHSLVIATRNGTVTGPDKANWRLVRGKTIADSRHPVVVAYPENWMALEVELSVEGDTEAADEGAALLREQVEEYGAALMKISTALREGGHLDNTTANITADEVAVTVLALLAPTEISLRAPVAPPTPPRKRAAPKA